jgi:isopentenyl-diphosphate delta-isomerase
MNIHQQLLLVDDHDTFSGQYADRLSCHTGKGLHHRAFVVVVFNDKKEILLQKRKHVLWDKFWDVTAISHVLHLSDHDETYEEAAQRSLHEEMGIPEIPLKNTGGFNYFAEYKDNYCENEYCSILIGKWNGIVKPNTNAVYEYTWMSLENFYADVKENEKKYAPWAILTAKFLMKNQSLRSFA